MTLQIVDKDYSIQYKENPFYSVDEIMDGELRVPFVMSENAIDLIRFMLDRNVETRPTIEQILDHPWFEGLPSPEEAMGIFPPINASVRK